MDDNTNQNTSETPKSGASASWEEVGREFEALGESLASAFRAAWEDETNRKRVEEMKAGLKSMVEEVGHAIEDTANTEHGKRIISEAERAAHSLHQAGKETMAEAQPKLVSALRQVNQELQKFIDRMEEKKNTEQP